MPSENYKKMFELERRTVQKITFCLYDWKPINFSLNFSLSLFLSQYLPMNIRKKLVFQQAMSIKSEAKTKNLGVAGWKVGQTWHRNNCSHAKKYNKNIETWLAKQIFSLLIWDRQLKFMLQHLHVHLLWYCRFLPVDLWGPSQPSSGFRRQVYRDLQHGQGNHPQRTEVNVVWPGEGMDKEGHRFVRRYNGVFRRCWDMWTCRGVCPLRALKGSTGRKHWTL